MRLQLCLVQKGDLLTAVVAVAADVAEGAVVGGYPQQALPFRHEWGFSPLYGKNWDASQLLMGQSRKDSKSVGRDIHRRDRSFSVTELEGSGRVSPTITQ